MEGGPGTSDPGRIHYRISLRYLVMAAYGVGSSRLSAPAWLDDKTFEIVATLPPATAGVQLRLILQNLLSETFDLTFHREQREMPVYTLTVAKGGPRLKDATDHMADIAADDFYPLPSGPPNELELDGEGYPIVPAGEGSWLVALRSGRARTHQFHASMRDLAALLENQLVRPVTDATGLTGRYEFTQSWMAGISAPVAGPATPRLPMRPRSTLRIATTARPEPAVVQRTGGGDRDRPHRQRTCGQLSAGSDLLHRGQARPA